MKTYLTKIGYGLDEKWGPDIKAMSWRDAQKATQAESDWRVVGVLVRVV